MSERPGVRLNPPYMHGAFLALNAVSDAYFLGDGPDCIRAKAEQIHGRHDLCSTLMSCDGEHRINYTGLSVFNIAANLEGEIVSGLRRIAARPGCGAVFLGAIPMCAIAGTDYERLLREALSGSGMPSFLIPPQSGLAGDWLDGYAAVLETLAKGMDLRGAQPRPRNVAVVGYLMGRNEGDHRGNVKELERMIRALGREPVSVWLCGGRVADLREVRKAEAIVSLPHGRRAARILAQRLGVRLVEAELPFGLAASRRFMEKLGREFKRESAARRYIAAELDDVAPRLQWTVPHAFLGRRFAYAGDPHYAAPFAETVEELGGRVAGMILLGAPRHVPEELRAGLLARPRTVFEPMQPEVERDWFGLSRQRADLFVTTTMALELIRPETSWVEFGYPSDYTHFLKDEPFLGFQGALGFLSRLANEVTRGLYASTPVRP
ncbi:MAG: nitrogenase component 1 [Elusimicrobia bacterium]|nr:nitrogenase component 1 [Elusimicrobiota bacterium]